MNYLKFFVNVSLIVTFAVALSSCEENRSLKFEDGTIFKYNVKGDDFVDEEDAYILSSSTKSSSVIPHDSDGITIRYRIRNASDLKLFCEQVNNGYFKKLEDQFRESCEPFDFIMYLEHDLTIDESFDWTPIGTSEYPMNMCFDGNDHTISGVMNSIGSDDYFYFRGVKLKVKRHGFFGSSGGVITNLNLEADLIISSFVSTSVVSGLLASELSGSVENVNVNGNLVTPIFNFACDYFFHGHIIGVHEYGDMKNCSSKGTITLKKQGLSTYSFKAGKAYVGGMIGCEKEGRVVDCQNYVDINISDAAIGDGLIVGGIVAVISSNMGYSEESIYMRNAENKGGITVDATRKISNNDKASIIIGGIMGEGRFSSMGGMSGEIINSGSISLGSTALNGYVGGIVGSYTDRNAKFVVLNTGNIINRSKRSYTGGCYGKATYNNISISHATNTGDITATEVELVQPEDSFGNIYGLVGGIVGNATIYKMGVLHESYNSDGDIHQCYNTGNIQSGGNFTYNGIECSTAGGISGDGLSVKSCNFSSGTINGGMSYPNKYNGTTWKAIELIDSGQLTEGDAYWRFWSAVVNNVINQYSCEHYQEF